MRIIKAKDYAEMSRKAANIIAAQRTVNNTAVITSRALDRKFHAVSRNSSTKPRAAARKL